MAPKKNDENTAKKTPIKRVVKPKLEKPKLRTPTVIRVKMPVNCAGPNGVTPKLTKKHLADQRKIEMANEVAHAQLSKESQVVLEPVVPITGKGKRKATTDAKDGPKPTKRKIKSSKSVSEQSPEASSEDVFEPKTPRRTPRKKAVPTKIKFIAAAAKDEKIESLNSAIVETREIKEAPIPPAKKSRGRPKASTKKNDIEVATSGETSTKVPANRKIDKPNKMRSTNGNLKCETTTPMLVKPGPKDSITDVNIVITRGSSKKSSKVTKRVSKKKASDTKDGPGNKCEAGAVGGRTSSIYSSTSGMSWTQDVSTSSTTTCVTVTSNDFVRFDKKLPVLQIADVRSELKSSYYSGWSWSSTTSPTASDDLEGCGSLDLSASTPVSAASSARAPPSTAAAVAGSRPSRDVATPDVASRASEQESGESRDAENRVSPEDMDKISAALDRLAVSLSNFDAEIVEWIGRGGERAGFTVPPALFNALQPESDTIMHCRALKRTLAAIDAADTTVATNATNAAAAVAATDAEFARPAPPRARAPPPDEPRATPPEERADDSAADRRFDDDDDALSLFAESITVIDSGRHPSAASAPEAYVPAAVAPSPFEPLCYRPTRIEWPRPKQTADSTSVRPPPAERSGSPAPAAATGPWQGASASLRSVPPVAPKYSALLRGLCFYNLVSQCRFEACRFAHAAPQEDETLRRAAALGVRALLRETTLVLEYPALRSRLGATVAAALARRGLTLALLQTAAALQSRPGSGAAAQAALEEVLQALSRAALPAALLELRAGAGAMCDALLRAVANTQNFSRFRAAFVRLAAHCATHAPGRVPHEVLTSVLERLCILPCDEASAHAMVRLVALADPRIYRDRMMVPFEAQLATVGGAVLQEFLRDKAARRPPTPPAPPAQAPSLAPPALPRLRYGERSTSLDTTLYDTLTKGHTIITRTVDFSGAQSKTTLVTFDPSVPPPTHQVPKSTGFSEWRKALIQNPNVVATNLNGVLGNRNGVVRNPNGIVGNPSGGAINPNAVNRPMMSTLINPLTVRRCIKRRASAFQRVPPDGEFFE